MIRFCKETAIRKLYGILTILFLFLNSIGLLLLYILIIIILLMNIIAWVVLGLIAGWLASIVAGTNRQQGMWVDIIFGVLGAIIGGFIFNQLGYAGVTGFNISSLIVAFVGAVVLIFARKLLIK